MTRRNWRLVRRAGGHFLEADDPAQPMTEADFCWLFDELSRAAVGAMIERMVIPRPTVATDRYSVQPD